MRKPAFLSNERLSRFVVSLLLCVGVTLPLMMTFGAGGSAALSLLISAAILGLMTALGSMKKGLLILTAAGSGLAVIQLFLPNAGFFGAAYEGIKAIALYLNGITTAAPLFGSQIALLLGVGAALLSYAFSAKGAGFLPATILVVLVLFGLWSLGKPVYLWYALPALVALLLLISQTSHEKINLFEVLPMAAIVVALSMLVLPARQATIPPLYEAAMNLKQTISDYLFFTEPRNVFTLGSYGYYPMGGGRLGGEAAPSEYPVMMVKTDKRTLMRAVVKDEYTGRNWRDTSSGKRYLYVNPRWSKLRESVFLEKMPAEAVQAASTILDQHAVTVQMQNTAASTVFTPVFLRNFSAQSDMVGYFNDASELFITRDLRQGDRYTVFTPIFEGGENGLGALIGAAPKGDDSYYQAVVNDYTKLPDHLEQKVYDDLNNIIGAASTPYEKACAIMRHLQRYYRYTLTPDEPPENQDFVTYFLYVGKEGYCTYYASAMTVLCRMAGLPARYVEGFLATPASDGFAYVTGLDAHAWTEVYFEGFGWVPFDATPAQQNMDNQPPQENEQPEPSPSPSPSPEPEPNEQPTPSPEPENPDEMPDMEDSDPPEVPPDDDKPPFPWWWWLLAAAAVAGLGARIYLRMPEQVAKKRTSEQDKIFVYGNATYMIMRLLKRTPRAGETPLLFARRMDKQKAFPAPVLPLWRMMALSNYSRMKPGAEQTARAKETFLRMYKPQRVFIKLRFMLYAAFGKTCYNCLDTAVEHVEPEKAYSYPIGKTPKKGEKPGRPSKKKPDAQAEAKPKPGKKARRSAGRKKKKGSSANAGKKPGGKSKRGR